MMMGATICSALPPSTLPATRNGGVRFIAAPCGVAETEQQDRGSKIDTVGWIERYVARSNHGCPCQFALTRAGNSVMRSGARARPAPGLEPRGQCAGCIAVNIERWLLPTAAGTGTRTRTF